MRVLPEELRAKTGLKRTPMRSSTLVAATTPTPTVTAPTATTAPTASSSSGAAKNKPQKESDTGLQRKR